MTWWPTGGWVWSAPRNLVTGLPFFFFFFFFNCTMQQPRIVAQYSVIVGRNLMSFHQPHPHYDYFVCCEHGAFVPPPHELNRWEDLFYHHTDLTAGRMLCSQCISTPSQNRGGWFIIYDDFANGTQNVLEETDILIYKVGIWTMMWTASPQYDGKAVFAFLQGNVLVAGIMVSYVKFRDNIHDESYQENEGGRACADIYISVMRTPIDHTNWHQPIESGTTLFHGNKLEDMTSQTHVSLHPSPPKVKLDLNKTWCDLPHPTSNIHVATVRGDPLNNHYIQNSWHGPENSAHVEQQAWPVASELPWWSNCLSPMQPLIYCILFLAVGTMHGMLELGNSHRGKHARNTSVCGNHAWNVRAWEIMGIPMTPDPCCLDTWLIIKPFNHLILSIVYNGSCSCKASMLLPWWLWDSKLFCIYVLESSYHSTYKLYELKHVWVNEFCCGILDYILHRQTQHSLCLCQCLRSNWIMLGLHGYLNPRLFSCDLIL